ncbi:MAG TPA: hypothetical protein VFG25_04275 [Nitrosopumilaceae archaeon]|nr:hypothetical protein [Nitrosopumilaceae archaeon]
MLSDDSAEKPKKKRGRPKGSKNKSAKTKDESKEKQEFENKLGETKPEKPKEKEPEANTPKKEESTKVVLSPPRTISADSFTNKRGSEVIFRREMGEPEFFLHKNQLVPPKPVLSPDEEQEISRKVQIPTDQTPKYEPEHMLSPEFNGLSNYERGVENHKQELEEELRQLKQNPDANESRIKQLEDEIRSIDYLFENYNLGMNVFRTAKGGRSKIKQ